MLIVMAVGWHTPEWRGMLFCSNYNLVKGIIMYNNSPLESLAAFAIVFVAGVFSTVGFSKYIEKVKKDAERGVNDSL